MTAHDTHKLFEHLQQLQISLAETEAEIKDAKLAVRAFLRRLCFTDCDCPDVFDAAVGWKPSCGLETRFEDLEGPRPPARWW